MAVYFAPQRQRVSINDLLYMIGGGLVNSMLQRSQAANQYKYDSRLAQEADARKSQEKRGYVDMLRDGVNANGNQQTGSADFIGGAIGSGANLQDLQNYWLPKTLTIDQGNQKTAAPMWSNGEIGDGRSYEMGIDPGKEKELTDKLQMFNSDLEWEKNQGMWDRDYKNRDLAQRGALGRAQINATYSRPHAGTMMPDGSGGYVLVDPYTGTTKPVNGVKVPQQRPTLSDAALKYAFGTGETDQRKNGGLGTTTPTTSPYADLLKEGILKAYAEEMGIDLPVKQVPFSDQEINDYANSRGITKDAAKAELSKRIQ